MANLTTEARNGASISPYGPARSTITGEPLSPEELDKIDAYWRASLYVCLGMLYLQNNPLLREPLKIEHFKPRMLGHWGRPGAFDSFHLLPGPGITTAGECNGRRRLVKPSRKPSC